MRRPSGFSLVELLVVVAVITAMLAILSPAVGKAIRMANLAVCASNVNQLALSTFAYAGDHFGHTPYVGQYHTYDQMEYSHYWSHSPGLTPPGFQNWGMLSKGRYISHQSDAWFCPIQSNPLYQNPGGPDPSHPNGTPGSKNLALWPGDEHLGWTFARSGYARRGFPDFTGRDIWKPIPLKYIADQAMICDVITYPIDVYQSGHGDGVTVGRGDGSVRLVAFDRTDSHITYWQNMSASHATSNNSYVKTLWTYLDRTGN